MVDHSRLWIDALRIQFVDAGNVPYALTIRSWGVAYVTNTVVQGDGVSDEAGVQAYRGGGGVVCRRCVCVFIWACDVQRRMTALP